MEEQELKRYEFNFDKGHAYSLGSGFGADSFSGVGYLNLPEGYVNLSNMMYREDGYLRPVYDNTGLVASVGTSIYAIYQACDGLYAVTNGNKFYHSSDNGSIWEEVDWKGTGTPTFTEKSINYNFFDKYGIVMWTSPDYTEPTYYCWHKTFGTGHPSPPPPDNPPLPPTEQWNYPEPEPIDPIPDGIAYYYNNNSRTRWAEGYTQLQIPKGTGKLYKLLDASEQVGLCDNMLMYGYPKVYSIPSMDLYYPESLPAGFVSWGIPASSNAHLLKNGVRYDCTTTVPTKYDYVSQTVETLPTYTNAIKDNYYIGMNSIVNDSVAGATAVLHTDYNLYAITDPDTIDYTFAFDLTLTAPTGMVYDYSEWYNGVGYTTSFLAKGDGSFKVLVYVQEWAINPNEIHPGWTDHLARFNYYTYLKEDEEDFVLINSSHWEGFYWDDYLGNPALTGLYSFDIVDTITNFGSDHTIYTKKYLQHPYGSVLSTELSFDDHTTFVAKPTNYTTVPSNNAYSIQLASISSKILSYRIWDSSFTETIKTITLTMTPTTATISDYCITDDNIVYFYWWNNTTGYYGVTGIDIVNNTEYYHYEGAKSGTLSNQKMYFYGSYIGIYDGLKWRIIE